MERNGKNSSICSCLSVYLLHRGCSWASSWTVADRCVHGKFRHFLSRRLSVPVMRYWSCVELLRIVMNMKFKTGRSVLQINILIVKFAGLVVGTYPTRADRYNIVDMSSVYR